MKIAFIGYGNVGLPLADHLQRLGHDVWLAENRSDSEKLGKAKAINAGLKSAKSLEAIQNAEVVFLATPFAANAAALDPVKDRLTGKILVDCTNPVGAGLKHGLESRLSGSETVQQLAPAAKVVKAFTIYGFENFEDNAYPGYGVKPAMLFCGADPEAKRVVGGLIAELGWEPVDVGGLEQALHLEHMTLLWIRMARAGGHSPNFVWARLKR